MFKKKVDPIEQAKAWKQSIRAQKRELERSQRRIEREEEKLKIRVKQVIKEGGSEAGLPLVRELVNSRKAKSKILKTCTQLDSLVREIDLQIAQVKVCGVFQQSVQVTHLINQFVKVPELQQSMASLQMEMEKAGVMSEMMDEAMELNEEDPEDAEVAAKLVYNQIVSEINKTARTPIPVLPVSQEEIEADPKAAALLS